MLKSKEFGPVTRIHLARTFFGRPAYTVEAYLVDGLLIDTGCPATAAELVAWCRERDVRQAVNTHHHEDHAGGNAALQQGLNLPIAAPPASLPILADFPRLQFYRRAVWGQPADVRIEPLGEVVETERYRFQVVPAPGHSPDQVCLFEPEQGWLFSGDLFIHQRARYLRADEDALGTIASLRRILELRPQKLFCAHAGVVEDGAAALQAKIDFWEDIREQARALRSRGLSLDEISRQALGAEGLLTRFTLGHFSKLNLICSLLGEGSDSCAAT
jgi:glyoxylase-like metal-dependent hydrolase (beta-lactamase superfamily II)